MDNDQDSTFTRAMLGGLFIGIIDTLICLAFNIGYRDTTGYAPSALVNVSSLIFAVNLLLLLIGMLYFLFIRFFGEKSLAFTIVILLLTLLGAWQTEIGHRFSDATVNAQWKGLLLGIVLILGISASTLPFLFRSKFFHEHVV
jgi:hypothetical protein